MKAHVPKISLIFLLIVVLVFAAVYFFGFKKEAPLTSVKSFEECVAEGNLVMESYPEKCVAFGKTFVRDIGNELELRNQIVVSNPRPNQVISSPLLISGEAVGNWFFEATFQVSLLDESGKGLGGDYLTSKGEWMTEEFVPFSGTLTFEKPSTSKGKLLFEKANPSGLSENIETLIVPVLFN